MIYGYIRVSSDKQTVENQRFEIDKFCTNEGLKIDGCLEVAHSNGFEAGHTKKEPDIAGLQSGIIYYLR